MIGVMNNENKDTIFETTVYQDRALVTRKLDVNLSEKDTEVVFQELPLNILRDSIRISGQGEASLKINGMDLREEYLEIYSSEYFQKMKEELDTLKDELSIITQKISDAHSRITMAQNFMGIQSHRFAEEFYFKKVDSENLKKQIQTYREICLGEITSISANEKKQRELQKKISKLEREMSVRKSSAGKTLLNCPVAITVSRPGKFTFYLSYVVMNAAWSPVYDARLFMDSQEVEISYYGSVSQNTGEEWDGVKLYLSTARPSISARLPELHPWWIDFSQYADVDKKPKYPGDYSLHLDEVTAGKPFYDTLMAQTSVKKGLSVTFGITEMQDLPPDGTQKKVLIMKQRFPADIIYRAYPFHTQAVFIIARIENTSEMPFLAGTVKVYHDQDYIGDSTMDNVLSGETIGISMGTDDNVKIKREKLKGFRQKKGITGNTEKMEYKYRITVNNYKNETVKLKLEESIPVSRNKELKVELTDIIPKSEPDIKGILNWDIELEKGQEKMIDISYTVEYPRAKTVVGLAE